MPQIFENTDPSSSILNNKDENERIDPENISVFTSVYLHITKVSTTKFYLEIIHLTSSFMTQLSEKPRF